MAFVSIVAHCQPDQIAGCVQDVPKGNASETKRKSRLKSESLCVNCGKPAVASRYRCSECCEKDNKNNKQRKTKLKELGLCIDCGKSEARNKSLKCEMCTIKVTCRTHFGSTDRHQELQTLLNSQNRTCPYTGIKLVLGSNASLDHKVPKSAGGDNEIQNLQWVHVWINSMKGVLCEEEFKKELKEFLLQSYSNINETLQNHQEQKPLSEKKDIGRQA